MAQRGNFMRWLTLLGLWSASLVLAAPGDDLRLAPPAFLAGGMKVVPIDIQTYDLDLVLDPKRHHTTGRARIVFFAKEAGSPMLDTSEAVTAVFLNGRDLGAQAFSAIAFGGAGDPHFHYIAATVAESSLNYLELTFDIDYKWVTYEGDKVGLGWFMTDLTEGGHLERYLPSNFEFDHFKMTAHVWVADTRSQHHLFANGEVSEIGPSEWVVDFPAFYNTSSFYFHLTSKDFKTRRWIYPGIERRIPVTVYGETDQLVENALTRVQEVMPDNEAIFGPFLHPRLIVYITDGGGGMEYCGATMTSEPAIRHELTHSWYARGVAPADGNAGWIDEAIATWRDSDFPSDSATPDRPPVNLAAFSPYNRVTPDESYSDGAKLMAELDFLTGGLKPLLKRFYLAHQRRLYTTDLFRRYLEKQSGLDLSAIFERYVYGKGTPLPEQAMASMVRYYHPRPYSLEELRRYR